MNKYSTFSRFPKLDLIVRWSVVSYKGQLCGVGTRFHYWKCSLYISRAIDRLMTQLIILLCDLVRLRVFSSLLSVAEIFEGKGKWNWKVQASTPRPEKCHSTQEDQMKWNRFTSCHLVWLEKWKHGKHMGTWVTWCNILAIWHHPNDIRNLDV